VARGISKLPAGSAKSRKRRCFAPAGVGYVYDANGNVTQTPDGMTYGYDVANRMVSNNAVYNPKNQHGFDGTNFYFYGVGGELIGKYRPNWNAIITVAGVNYTPVTLQDGRPNLYFNGRAIQLQGHGTFVMTDRLGSVRVNANGQRMNYYPYGAEVGAETGEGRVKFGTYTRDSAGVDYADQRYYGAGMGRFLTPDPGGIKTANPNNPSTWNWYSYVMGDPVNRTDIHGLCSDQDDPECYDEGGGGSGGGDDMEIMKGDDPADRGNDGDFVNCEAGVTCFSVTGTTATATGQMPTTPTGPSQATSMPSPMYGPPDSFFILPRGLGPVIRIIGPDGGANYDIHYQPNHPTVGNPHGHPINGGKPGAPEPIPPGSNIPARPAVPPDSVGPYSPWPRQRTPTIGPSGPPGTGGSVIITINPCLFPIIRDLPSCRTGAWM
jgi:RHS repeat-associated protein